ncbi:hypothetical protein HS041_12315 [Planomonospora sp. ID67723]|uniref:hypothetical protein n=1 Tax=Planomonospora sp. ID67723 TaxID=2738134 RepID=UPI0018C36DEF|nr:hypothetical protein [Planomonospora sp. ID67723]MBG0828553.1 hypothetical protein [Planomonospora sp. ID67723]
MADIDATELYSLIGVFENAKQDAARRTYPVVKEHAQALRDQWRDNARQSAGRHGRHYPRAITAEQMASSADIEWEVGPESRLPQGGMGRGFEFGSVNQPPHLDGMQAANAQEPKLLKALDDIARGLL